MIKSYQEDVMILLLKRRANSVQIEQMLEEYQNMIKIAVDIRRDILAGGGEMHADCEQFLLQDGSEQDDLWGANWYPGEQRVEFEALMNIRPRLGNRSMIIQDENIRCKVEAIARQILGEIQ
jgi:hypothetical protein